MASLSKNPSFTSNRKKTYLPGPSEAISDEPAGGNSMQNMTKSPKVQSGKSGSAGNASEKPIRKSTKKDAGALVMPLDSDGETDASGAAANTGKKRSGKKPRAGKEKNSGDFAGGAVEDMVLDSNTGDEEQEEDFDALGPDDEGLPW